MGDIFLLLNALVTTLVSFFCDSMATSKISARTTKHMTNLGIKTFNVFQGLILF